MVKWISTTKDKPWIEEETKQVDSKGEKLELTDITKQTINGFGGCFNELGWIALSKIDKSEREKVIDSLFSKDKGAAFNLCRIPIGASDYAESWYSHNEYEDDYEMEHFSIERDHRNLLPYIKSALKRNSNIDFFASPWSPPTWMKFPKAHNNGRLKMEKKVLDAYALYFKKFIEAYNDEGVNISKVHIQNEPFANQKFPSCLWSSEQFKIFIRDYIGPKFEKWGLDTKIWLGTLNGPTQMSMGYKNIELDLYDKYVDNILFDSNARQYISGIGYQWAGQHVIQRTNESFPELELMQTENECGDGNNTFEYAQYVFNLIKHYFNNGVNSYTYWNMVLEPGGESTWGWKQNSLITINPETKLVNYNHEYYLMKHFSKYIDIGAKLIKTTGHFTGASVAFENPDGSRVIIVSNALNYERIITIEDKQNSFSYSLKPNSFNTFVLK